MRSTDWHIRRYSLKAQPQPTQYALMPNSANSGGAVLMLTRENQVKSKTAKLRVYITEDEARIIATQLLLMFPLPEKIK